MATVGGGDVDQDRSYLRGRVLEQYPLGAVRSPDADPVTLADAGGKQPDAESVSIGIQSRVGPASAGRHVHQGLARRVSERGPAKVGADGLAEQRLSRCAVTVG